MTQFLVQYDLYILAGVIGFLLGPPIARTLVAEDTELRPASALEMMAWVGLWVLLNVVANTNGMQTVADLVLRSMLGVSLDNFALASFDTPWVLLALVPSLAQYNFQEDSTRIFSSTMETIGSVLVFFIDWFASAAGVYFWLYTLAGVTLEVFPPMNWPLLALSLAVAWFGGVMCQYKAHRLWYYATGRIPPTVKWPGDNDDDEKKAGRNKRGNRRGHVAPAGAAHPKRERTEQPKVEQIRFESAD